MSINKKAISPIIATVLLIVVAVLLIVLVSSWGRSFTKDSLDDISNITDYTISDVSNLIYSPKLNNNLLSFSYYPTGNLKDLNVTINRYSVPGSTLIKNLDENSVTLREGTVFINGFDLSDYNISTRKTDVFLHTLNDEIVILKNLNYYP